MVKEMPASNAGGGGSQKLYEVTASGIDQNWPYTIYNSNRVRTRSADHEGSGLFDVECNSECATGSGRNRPWCSTSGNGGWGYCADSELVSKDKQTVTGGNLWVWGLVRGWDLGFKVESSVIKNACSKTR